MREKDCKEFKATMGCIHSEFKVRLNCISETVLKNKFKT